VSLVQFVVFAKTRSDNLLQIESHEKQNFSDSRSKRKSVATRLWRVNVASQARPAETWPKKKLQDSERILQLNFANSASLNLRLSHAQPYDAPSVQCNKHEPFGRIAVALSQPGQQR
jgi:hypothetical protein